MKSLRLHHLSKVILSVVVAKVSLTAFAQESTSRSPTEIDPLLRAFLESPTTKKSSTETEAQNDTTDMGASPSEQKDETVPASPRAFEETSVPQNNSTMEEGTQAPEEKDFAPASESESSPNQTPDSAAQPWNAKDLQLDRTIVGMPRGQSTEIPRLSLRLKFLTAKAEHEGLSRAEVRRGNHYSMPSDMAKDTLNGGGVDAALRMFDHFLLTASFAGLSGKIDKGSVHRSDSKTRWYFEDSDMRFNDAKLGLRYNFAPGMVVNPFVEIGGEWFSYEVHYAYTLTYWYWKNSGNVFRTERHNRPGMYKGDDTAPYVKGGIEMNSKYGSVRVGGNYSSGFESAWAEDDDSSFTIFLDATMRLWGKLLFGVELAEIPAGNISYVGFQAGWAF